jgi:hypothetical protein
MRPGKIAGATQVMALKLHHSTSKTIQIWLPNCL